MLNWFASLAKLGGAAFAAKLLPFIALPIVTRLYSSDEIGIINSIISLSLILAPVLSLRLSMAIPIAHEAGEEFLDYIFSLIFFLALIVFALLLLACLFGWVEWYLLSVPIFSFFIALWEMNILELGRGGKVGAVNKILIFRELVETSLKVGLGLVFCGGVWGLFVAYLGYLLSPFLVLGRSFAKKIRFFNVVEIAKTYSGIIIYRFPSHFIMVFCVQFPVVYTMAFQSDSDVGMVSMAFFVLGVPISIISQTVGNVFYAKYSAERKERRGFFTFLATFIFLLFVSGFAYVALDSFSDLFVRMVLGDEWLVVADYIEIMSLYFCLQLLSAPLVNVFSAHGRDYLYLFVNVMRLVVVLIVGWISLGTSVSNFLALYANYMFGFYCVVIALVFWVFWSDRGEDVLW